MKWQIFQLLTKRLTAYNNQQSHGPVYQIVHVFAATDHCSRLSMNKNMNPPLSLSHAKIEKLGWVRSMWRTFFPLLEPRNFMFWAVVSLIKAAHLFSIVISISDFFFTASRWCCLFIANLPWDHPKTRTIFMPYQLMGTALYLVYDYYAWVFSK